MAIITGLPKNFLGLAVSSVWKPPSGIQSSNEVRFNSCNAIQQGSRRLTLGGRVEYPSAKHTRNRRSLCVRRGHYHTSDEEEPFWLTLTKEAAWALKSLCLFLVEQPSQLKYIEWPSFQNTVKTASLALVLIAILIVALSSVDSILCYLLALILRRTP